MPLLFQSNLSKMGLISLSLSSNQKKEALSQLLQATICLRWWLKMQINNHQFNSLPKTNQQQCQILPFRPVLKGLKRTNPVEMTLILQHLIPRLSQITTHKAKILSISITQISGHPLIVGTVCQSLFKLTWLMTNRWYKCQPTPLVLFRASNLNNNSSLRLTKLWLPNKKKKSKKLLLKWRICLVTYQSETH